MTTMLILERQQRTERKAADNTGLAKVALQCSVDTFVVNQSLVLHINLGSTEMVQIATFAKPETVTCKRGAELYK